MLEMQSQATESPPPHPPPSQRPAPLASFGLSPHWIVPPNKKP